MKDLFLVQSSDKIWYTFLFRTFLILGLIFFYKSYYKTFYPLSFFLVIENLTFFKIYRLPSCSVFLYLIDPLSQTLYKSFFSSPYYKILWLSMMFKYSFSGIGLSFLLFPIVFLYFLFSLTAKFTSYSWYILLYKLVQ